MIAKESFYRYALNKDGQIVHVSEVNEENRHDGYRCVSCGCELTPVLGEKNAHHFRHKTDACSYESYIHKLWKQYIYEQWHKIEHLYVTYNVEHFCDKYATCKLKIQRCNTFTAETIDLKTIYDTCEIEGSYGGYRADILLKNSNNPDIRPTFIEVFYKHPCDEAKQNAGIQIIELKVFDDNLLLPLHLKEDSSLIPGYSHSTDNKHGVTLYGLYGFVHKTESECKVRRFCVYQDENGINHGKVDDTILSCHDTYIHCPDSMMEIFVPEEVLARQRSFLELGIAIAGRYNVIIKHCLHCVFKGNRGKTCQMNLEIDKESFLININDFTDSEFDKTQYAYNCMNYGEMQLWKDKSIDCIPHMVWRNKSYISKPFNRPTTINGKINKEKLKSLASKNKNTTR